jgi:uncharacterized membrane protein
MLILRPDFQHEGRQILSIALPIFWLIANVLVAIGSNKEKENEKISLMAMWMLVIVSWVTAFAIYTMSFSCDLSIHTTFPLFSGAVFFLFGNYLPKINPSKEKMSPIAVAMPWLYATINKDKSCSIQANRFAAKIWVLGGIGLTLTVFFQSIAFLYADAAIMIAMFVIPVIFACVKFKNVPR